MRKTKGILLLIAALLVCLTVIFVGCDSGNTNSDNSGGNSNNSGNVSNDSGNTSDAKCSHNWNDATCTAPKTCSKCGETEGEALGHTWVDATCSAPKTCSVCEKTEGEALGHAWVDATCVTARTCYVCEVTHGDALGHTWTDATCDTPKTCSVCKETEGEALGHSWVSSSCGTPQKCSICSASGEIQEHDWINATCSTPKTCTVCDLTEGGIDHNWQGGKCNVCNSNIFDEMKEYIIDSGTLMDDTYYYTSIHNIVGYTGDTMILVSASYYVNGDYIELNYSEIDYGWHSRMTIEMNRADGMYKWEYTWLNTTYGIIAADSEGGFINGQPDADLDIDTLLDYLEKGNEIDRTVFDITGEDLKY